MSVDLSDPKMDGYVPLQDFIDQDQDQSSRRIRDMPYGKRKEEIQINVDTLTFADTGATYESPALVVTLTNTGYDTVNIYGHTLQGEFELKSSLPGSIQAGEVVTVQLSFKPTTVGAKTGSIYFDTGSAAGDELVTLQGTGIMSAPEVPPEDLQDFVEQIATDAANAVVNTKQNHSANLDGWSAKNPATFVLDEDNMASDAPDRPPSQQSVKAYLSNHLEVNEALFGFVDDGATANDAAWAAAKAALPAGSTIHFRKRTTGRYYFAANPADFTGLVIHAPVPITFTGAGVYIDRSSAQVLAGSPGVTVTPGSKLTFYNTFFNSKFDFWGEQPEKFDFLTDGDVAHEDPAPVDMTTANMQQFAWPNAATSTAAATGITVSANAIAINWATAPVNALILAGFVPEVGSQYTWNENINNSDVTGAMLVFAGGYHMVYASVGSAAIHKKLTAPATFTETSVAAFIDATTEAGYQFSRASITVDMLSPTKYQVGVNGVVVAEGDLPSPATYVGPVLYRGVTTALTSSMNNVVKTRSPTRLAPRPLRMLYVGDSKTDAVQVGWPRDISRILQDSLGVQVEFQQNIAVAGQTLAQQKAILLATSIVGISDVFIALGTNDTQGLSNAATFTADLQAVLTYVTSLGARVVVLTTPAFYDRANAVAHGGTGQLSQNGLAVPFYREIIRRVAADYRVAGNKVAVVDAGKVLGPTLAAYLDWPGTQSLVDPNVFDNIHETRRARKKLAHAMARAALGLMTYKRALVAPNLFMPSGGTLNFGNSNYVITHSSGTITFGGDVASTGSIRSSSPTKGIGYSTGAGGTVTQLTNKGAAITLNKLSGQVTTDAAAMAAGAVASFVFNNSAMESGDVLVLNHFSGGTLGAYSLNGRCYAGTGAIDIRNNTAGSLSEALVIEYVVIKGVRA